MSSNLAQSFCVMQAGEMGDLSPDRLEPVTDLRIDRLTA
jgi:hypothetical protein